MLGTEWGAGKKKLDEANETVTKNGDNLENNDAKKIPKKEGIVNNVTWIQKDK